MVAFKINLFRRIFRRLPVIGIFDLRLQTWYRAYFGYEDYKKSGWFEFWNNWGLSIVQFEQQTSKKSLARHLCTVSCMYIRETSVVPEFKSTQFFIIFIPKICSVSSLKAQIKDSDYREPSENSSKKIYFESHHLAAVWWVPWRKRLRSPISNFPLNRQDIKSK